MSGHFPLPTSLRGSEPLANVLVDLKQRLDGEFVIVEQNAGVHSQ